MSKNSRPIIIKKVYEEAGHAHHGGAWKVAYADFVTAMMAFFLLLWILSSVQEEKLEGLADYFTPTMNQQAGIGGNGLIDGNTIGEPGTLNSSNSPMSTIATPNFGQQDPLDATQSSPEVIIEYEEGPSSPDNMLSEIEKALQKNDDQNFADLEEKITQAMNEVPDLKPLIPNVIFDRTDEGLRIQIIDQEGRSMFASGKAVVEGRTKLLMQLVGQTISQLPNNVLISGHTDAVPFANELAETGYGNWELSADRANATRRIFTSSGVPMQQIGRVAGLADTTPFVSDDPRHPSNRRISVVLEYAKAPALKEVQDAVKNAGEKPSDSPANPAKTQDDNKIGDEEPDQGRPQPRVLPNTITIDELRQPTP